MFRKLLCLLLLSIVTAAFPVSAEVQPKFLTPVFSGIAATPRVVKNDVDSLWVVAWRQGTPGNIYARTVRANGQLGPRKTVAMGTTTATNSFDFAHDSIANKYLFAFETPQGLQVQPLNSILARQGSPLLIEAGIQNSKVRIVFDPTRNQYLLFWLTAQAGVNGKTLKVQQLDSAGKPIAGSKIVRQAASGKNFETMSIARNGKTGNVLVMLLEMTQGTTGSVIGYSVKPDGNLLKPQALQFQPPTASLNTIPEISFEAAGTGFAFWNDRNFVKFRKISALGGFASPTRSITNTANIDSRQIGAAYDSGQSQFLAVWSEGKQLKSARLNSKTGAIMAPPTLLTNGSLTTARHVQVSYSSQQNASLIVWEDAAPTIAGGPDARFRIRAAIMGGSGSGGGSGTVISALDISFAPRTITIRAGTTVRWQNTSTMTHTVTSGKPGTGSGSLFDMQLDPGKSVSFTFTQPGTYDFFCRVHSAVMRGVITVTP